MPYVLHNQSSGELHACMQVNHYDLGYYGVKAWETKEQAEAECADLLREGHLTGDWQVLQVEEQTLKLSNVKLKNNPAYVVFWSDQSLRVSRRETNEL
ncbi:hypothetical protein DUZ99_11620 [Xylanibacillus composti]|uniref:Uncharacterized protein n=1 Tax=Xylanibacillus composti TaxID=1572762 RepID=A0A8J4M0Q0_9BACL|nr:hypothetical protein [Xylanibacillus composti]MDT9725621.1 hypothetical protein [Xylanibacillus composti]GIQ67714.1 hypothetical protein XYCOK13_05380 [Xylanibacillus composti]